MRRFLTILLLLGSFATAFSNDAVTGANRTAAAPAAKTSRVLKVLPLLLDLQGHDAKSPSLYDRDAYQAFLRQHTNEISAIRFDVLWKASNLKDAKLKLRAELRGVGERSLPRQTVLERKSRPLFSAVGLR